jgi:LytR cell envelope-related transcriptional attenuator
MDAEPPTTGTSGSLSVLRAVAVIAIFVVAVVVLVAVGTRPSVSSTAAPTTTTTAAASGSSTTTTAAGGAGSSSTTTTSKSGHKGAATTTSTTVAPSSVSVVVANGTSVTGLAAHYSSVIGAGGWAMQTPIDTSSSQSVSAVYYEAGMQQPAASIATSIGVKPTQVLPVSSSIPVSGVSGVDVVVVIGQDLASTTTSTTAS